MQSFPNLSNYLALASCVLLTTTAQLLLKTGASKKGHIIHSFLNRYTVAGYGLFVLGTVSAVYAMQVIDMKVGSTWSGMSYMLVVILANLLLKESLSREKLTGCAFITLGILVFHMA
jgi:uncharacterized membrane protein